MPQGTREQVDQIVFKPRASELELSRSKTLPEAAKKNRVTEHACAVLREC